MKKFILNLNWIVGWLLILFLIGGCQQKPTQITPKYDGNYPTAQIRSIWMICSVSWRQKNPFIEPVTLWKVCDCYTDTIRELLTPEETDGPETIKKVKLTKILAEKCNSIIPPVKPT